MKRPLILIFSLAAIVTWTLSTRAADVKPADAKAVYDKQCAKCHGKTGKGDTKMGKKLKAANYTDPKVQAKLKDEVAFKAIKEGVKKNGKTRMKPAKGLNDEQMKALVKYVRAFAKKK